MKKNPPIPKILLCHFIGFTIAIGGWLWEVLLFLIKEQKFVNRGFLYGPWLPVYGCGAVVLSLFYDWLKNKKASGRTRNAFCRMPEAARIFLFCTMGGSAIEYAIGWFLTYFGLNGLRRASLIV